MRDANPAQILRLKAQVATVHFCRVSRNEKASDARHEDRLQCFQIPNIGGDEVQIVVRIEMSRLVNDMGLALNVRDQKLRFIGERWINAVNRTVPAVWIFL